jgi:hypothetical protein
LKETIQAMSSLSPSYSPSASPSSSSSFSSPSPIFTFEGDR